VDDPVAGPPAWFEFNGHRYHRNARAQYYYDPTGNLLHRAVWAASHGPIPAGHEVHHLNTNRSDNRLSNLVLLTEEAHQEHHAALQRHPAIPPRPCAVCGAEFQPTVSASHVRCCSTKCGSVLAVRTRREHGLDGYHTRVARDVVCKQCGVTFSSKSANAAVCSDQCREDRRRARNAGDASYKPGRYRQPIVKTCAACGREFEASKRSTECCSDECRRARNVEQARSGWSGRPPTEYTCQYCDARFESRATVAKFCSKLCRARSRRAVRRAELGL
jgi:hypothetical protein